MKVSTVARMIVRRSALLVVVVLALGACTSAEPTPSTTASASAAADIPDWRTDPDEPYPFTTPVPPLVATDIDGVFTRDATDTYTGTRAHCVRCPPYPVDRSNSTLTFDSGRYEIVHLEPHYRTFGHFTLEGDVLTLFNDPECSGEVGTYEVERDGAQLRLDVIEDRCAWGRRAGDLEAKTWTPAEIARGESCQPPNTEAAISGHWAAPSGC